MNDGHSASCTWKACAHPEAGPCPLVRDVRLKVMAPTECKHEWRQYWHDTQDGSQVTKNFYCIFCLEIQETY